jgi:sulfate permease, SulP family
VLPTGQLLRADALVGLLGALLALPQGIVFATLGGMQPQYGLYAAVVPCIVAALIGLSHRCDRPHQSQLASAVRHAGTPGGAVGSLAYVESALAVTVLVGLLQFATCALGLGTIATSSFQRRCLGSQPALLRSLRCTL